MTGDPARLVHEDRERERSKSRISADRMARDTNTNLELNKYKIQNGTKNYLKFQDHDRIRQGVNLELARRNNEFVGR